MKFKLKVPEWLQRMLWAILTVYSGLSTAILAVLSIALLIAPVFGGLPLWSLALLPVTVAAAVVLAYVTGECVERTA